MKGEKREFTKVVCYIVKKVLYMFTSTFFPQWTLLKIKGRQSFSPPSPLHFERGEEQGRFFKVLPSPEEEFYTGRREVEVEAFVVRK